MTELSPQSIGITKFNQSHGADGRFSSGAGQVAYGKPTSLSVMASRLREPDGGFTIDPRTGAEPTSGYAVSIHPERTRAMGDVSKITAEKLTSTIITFRGSNADLLSVKGNNIGAWHDPATHLGHLDISAVVPTAREARELGSKHGQIAYFDISGGKSVEL